MNTDTKIVLHWLMIGVIAIGGALLIVILSHAKADEYIPGYGVILDFSNGDQYDPQSNQWNLNLPQDNRRIGDAYQRPYQNPYQKDYQSNEKATPGNVGDWRSGKGW